MESTVAQFEHLKIQIEAIMSATNDFSDGNCIGRGGFGKVYKGQLVHFEGKPMVAFKRLNRAFGQGDPEFWKEIMMLSFYKHPNIVSLIGYCNDCDEKILVYEYAQKGSLDLYLNSNELSWIRRLKICIGAARGLAYLHTPMENQLRVLHRDIKSSNILLDENWDAKISDFGLSKFGPANQQFTFLVSNAVGTIGYCDPLYVETGLLTKESDVYSFGVVLFEVLCGRLCIGNNNNKYRPLTGLVRRCYKENKLHEIIHGCIKDEINPKSLETFADIAYQCLKRDRKERPLLTEIVDALENALNYQVDANTNPLGRLIVQIDRAVKLSTSEYIFFNENDFSDAHVIVSMGEQTYNTRLVKGYINHVWNEKLTFSILDPELPIKLAVCHVHRHHSVIVSKTLFTEYHLVPFLECVKMRLERIPSGTVITRLKPSESNFLAEESCIIWENNKLVQDLCLRLQDVEHGQVKIELHWIDIPWVSGKK